MKMKELAFATVLGLTASLVAHQSVGAETATVMEDGLRKRQQASTSSLIYGMHFKGDKVNVVSSKGVWTKVNQNGLKYYVASKFLKKDKPVTNKEIVSEQPIKKPFMLPTTGRFTQLYGKASGNYGYTFHNGLDIANATGTPVKASASGKVIYVSNRGAYGNHLMIEHTINKKTYTTVYAHMNKLLVYSNQKVKKGETIGTIGTTGNSTGPHLHFEIHQGSYVYSPTYPLNSVNPLMLAK